MASWHGFCLKEGTVRHFRQGEFFSVRGEILKYWGFVLKGCFKYTMANTDGNEHIMGFSFENTLVGHYLSIFRKEPSATNIIATTDTDVLVCSGDLLRRRLESFPGLRQDLADALFRQAYLQFLDLHCHSPKERYSALLRRCPSILQNVSLKELASFLRITPTHLSRIRRQLTFIR